MQKRNRSSGTTRRFFDFALGHALVGYNADMNKWLLCFIVTSLACFAGCNNLSLSENPAGKKADIDQEYGQHIANAHGFQASLASDLADWYQNKSDTGQEFPEPATTNFQNALQDDADVLMDLLRRQKFIEENSRVPESFSRSNDVLKSCLLDQSNAIAQMMDGVKNRNAQTINAGEEIFNNAVKKLDKMPK